MWETMANNRIAYGLARKHNIDTTGMSPGEVWKALKEKGVTPESAEAEEKEKIEKAKNAYVGNNDKTDTLDDFVLTDEFRYIEKHSDSKVKGHPAHVYAKSDEKAKYMQITHSEYIKDLKEANIELKQNPNPKDARTAYIIPKSEIANLEDLGKIKNGWKLSEIDNNIVIVYRDKPFNEK